MYIRVLLIPILLCILPAMIVGQEGVWYLVLDNGQVVDGRIEQGPDTTTVSKTSGSRIVFPNSRIDCVCHTKSELYWHKCALLGAADTVGHARLFQWCLENGLHHEARNQIDLLQLMDVSANRLFALNQQLLDAIDRRAQQLAREEYERQYAITDLPLILKEDGTIRLTSFETPMEGPSLKPESGFFDIDSSLFDPPGGRTPEKAPVLEGIHRVPKHDGEPGDGELPEKSTVSVDPADPEEFNRLYLEPQGDSDGT